MDGNKGNNLKIHNFGGNPELAHERLTSHGHSGYKVYAIYLRTGDDAKTSKFEYMLVHKPGQGPFGGHLVNEPARVCRCDGRRNFSPRE
jgi:hypothetical protein